MNYHSSKFSAMLYMCLCNKIIVFICSLFSLGGKIKEKEQGMWKEMLYLSDTIYIENTKCCRFF